MYKKIFSILGTFSIICFSFYYTDTAIDIIRKTDPIMKEIVEYSNAYGNTSVDSILVNNNIIPGIRGNIVDLDESYNNMKRLGKFDKSLIVFEEVFPANSLVANYDYYIISGNTSTNNVSIVFIIDDTSYVEDIIKILNKKNVVATFFVGDDIFDDSLDLIKLILNSGHDVELKDDDYDVSDIKKYNAIKKMISGKGLEYCYSEYKNSLLLDNCKKEKLYTIIPSIATKNYLYNDVKNNLKNGSIIAIENNSNSLRELSSAINYIFQKGKMIVSLEKMLQE